MNNCLIVFASATTANRVANILNKKFGIKARLLQTPASVPAPGCSYCLRIDCDHADKARRLIKENGLSSKGVFRENDFS